MIQCLKNSGSTGHDGISIRILKTIDPLVADFLFNQSTDYGYYPSVLKLAIVIPVHKKGAENT